MDKKQTSYYIEGVANSFIELMGKQNNLAIEDHGLPLTPHEFDHVLMGMFGGYQLGKPRLEDFVKNLFEIANLVVESNIAKEIGVTGTISERISIE